LHPAPRSGGELSLRVTTASGSRFVSALRCHAEASGCELRVPTLGVDELSFAAFGALELQELRLGGAHYLLAIAPDKLPLNTAQARTWLHDAVAGLAAYYQGALPAKHALVLLLRGAAGPTRGKTLSRGGPAVLLRAGDEISAQTTRDDWVLTHELLHVNFPDIGRDHAWLSEGLASYVEPIARARAGLLAPAKFWQDLIEGLPEGQPEQGDQGLENTATWGRIYWGGALFCFVADLQIRERTHNQHSLDDVLRAVAATGANVESTMSLPRLWDIGDAATGTRVLHELYERTALRPETTDLDALFQKLGVSLEDGRVRFDDSAPWAETRRLLTDPRSNQDFVPASVTNQEVPRTTP
jgi:hypothetical protein